MPHKSRAPTTAVAPTSWFATNIICATSVSATARTPGVLVKPDASRSSSMGKLVTQANAKATKSKTI